MSLDKKSDFIFTDEELISRFQKGDERAYVELVNRYKDRLLNFVFQFLGFCPPLLNTWIPSILNRKIPLIKQNPAKREKYFYVQKPINRPG